MTIADDRNSVKRRYDNSSREQKAEQTRLTILSALAEQLVNQNSTDFSVDEAARRAGVSTRTLFRYFPNKESMLEAMSEWVFGITGKIDLPSTPDQLEHTIEATYQMFEQNSPLMQALLLSDLGRGIRHRLAGRRRKGVADALDSATRNLSPEEARAVKALIVHIITAEAWWQMRDAYGVPGEDSARVVRWATRLMLQALDNGDHPFATPDEGNRNER